MTNEEKELEFFDTDADREVALTGKECRIIARLIQNDMEKATERANLLFRPYIDNFEMEMIRKIAILKKISAPYIMRSSENKCSEV